MFTGTITCPLQVQEEIGFEFTSHAGVGEEHFETTLEIKRRHLEWNYSLDFFCFKEVSMSHSQYKLFLEEYYRCVREDGFYSWGYDWKLSANTYVDSNGQLFQEGDVAIYMNLEELKKTFDTSDYLVHNFEHIKNNLGAPDLYTLESISFLSSRVYSLKLGKHTVEEKLEVLTNPHHPKSELLFIRSNVRDNLYNFYKKELLTQKLEILQMQQRRATEALELLHSGKLPSKLCSDCGKEESDRGLDCCGNCYNKRILG